MTTRLLLAWLALAVLAPAHLAAQGPDSAGTNPRRWRLDGDLGSEGELYRMSGRDPRRPPETGTMFFNPTLAYGSLTVTGNFLLSTEGSSSLGLGGLPGRQRINRFGLSPRWGWGKAYLGSFSDSYTALTWSGVRVDGVGLDLTPRAGALRFGMFTGSSRQPVFGGATSGSFARRLVGARVGVGRRAAYGPSGTFLDVVFLRAADDPASLPPLADTTPVPYLPDSLAAEPDTALLPHVPINPWAVTPQENAVLATAAGVSVLGGALSLTGEAAASIHSRDRRATPLPDEYVDDFPGFLRGLVSPRVGTHADQAYKGQLDVHVARLPGATTTSPRSLTLSVGYQSIGAGYVSLGTPYMPNDLRGLDFRSQLRFRHWALQVDGLSQRDNLVGQKLATTDRSRLGFALTVQPIRSWHAALRATTVGMQRDLADSLGGVDYAARTLSTSQTWIPGNGSRIRSVTASYTWQESGDEDPGRTGSQLDSHGADLRIAFHLGTRASITPSAGLTRSRVGTEPAATRALFGLAADWRDAARRWVTSASASRSQIGRTSALTTRLSARWSVTEMDQLTLVWRTSRYRSLIDAKMDFDEQVMSLRWGRRL
ncbi:MAG TPA: hypothetical protein VLE53_03500 [Gemmatimonadaceae bacterium]|nr:hypothetical protein [Gemmatimonadaceae bacterium]